MSSYTMELRTYIEMWSQNENLSVRDRIEKGRTKLFDFEYPIFDEAYKKVFETHFIRHFYMREIGAETEELFKFNLETWLLINMPYFNKLFESELLTYDPLTNAKMETSHTTTKDKTRNDTRDSTGTSHSDGTQNTSSNGTVTDDNFNRHLKSNNPDNRLAITTNDGQGVIQYASEIDEDTDNNTSTSSGSSDVTETSDGTTSVNDTLNSDINETEDFVMNRVGKIGVQTYAKMIEEYRAALLQVEKQIFKSMQELFMLVY